MSFLLERDSINGKDGKAFIQIDGKNIELFRLKKFEANGEFQVNPFKVVGTRVEQDKVSGIRFDGAMNLYYGSPLFVQLVKQYMKGRRIPYFNIMAVNNDTTATVGKQTIILLNCKLTGKIPLSLLDCEDDALTQNVQFSYMDFDLIDNFKKEESYGGTPGSDGTDFSIEGIVP